MAHVYHIELTNVCDLRCSYCSLTTSQRPKGFMSEETFRKVVEHASLSSPLNLVLMHHFGEPLLHPRLERFVAIAAEAHLNPGFSTNGQTLTVERFEDLVRHGLRWMCITFHEPEGEAAYHALRELAERRGVLLWGRRLTEAVEPYDLNAIVAYGIEHQVLHTFAGTVGEEQPRPPGWTPPCDFLERNFVCVLHDGRVVPCAMDERGEVVLGTVDDLASIRQRDGYERCRTCQGFRFYEPFRKLMAAELQREAPRMEASGWVAHLPLDDDPGSWRRDGDAAGGSPT